MEYRTIASYTHPANAHTKHVPVTNNGSESVATNNDKNGVSNKQSMPPRRNAPDRTSPASVLLNVDLIVEVACK